MHEPVGVTVIQQEMALFRTLFRLLHEKRRQTHGGPMMMPAPPLSGTLGAAAEEFEFVVKVDEAGFLADFFL